jgi:hypothetical protein
MRTLRSIIGSSRCNSTPTHTTAPSADPAKRSMIHGDAHPQEFASVSASINVPIVTARSAAPTTSMPVCMRT